MKKSSDGPSRAEKRALWEVRQRYNAEGATPRTSRRQRVASEPANPPPRRRLQATKPPSHTRWGRRIVFGFLLATLLSSGIFGYKIIAAGNQISTTDRSILGQLSDLLFKQGNTLAGEEEGRINILLLAIGGEGHKGENLADTIMVASVKPETQEVALLSIPRDLYVQVPGEDYFTKINAVHSYGEGKEASGGPVLLAEKVEEITGLPIHYYGRVDFTAFKQIIDAVGGVNITIDNSFYDYWHKIAFSAGTEKMDGERALAYVRARYVEGPEGGDFKRAARQQQILLALREKTFSVNTALDFTALNAILNSLSDNIRTDMELWEMKRFYEMARMTDASNLHSVVLTTGPQGVLVSSTEVLGGVPASVLKPRTDDYSEIQSIAQNIFSEETKQQHSASSNIADARPVAEAPPSPTPTPEETEEPATKPSVEVRNGTTITGLAQRTADTLETEGYSVTTIGNAARQDIDTTTVYALKTDEDTANGAQAIASSYGFKTAATLPEGEASSSAAVLIILGPDAE